MNYKLNRAAARIGLKERADRVDRVQIYVARSVWWSRAVFRDSARKEKRKRKPSRKHGRSIRCRGEIDEKGSVSLSKVSGPIKSRRLPHDNIISRYFHGEFTAHTRREKRIPDDDKIRSSRLNGSLRTFSNEFLAAFFMRSRYVAPSTLFDPHEKLSLNLDGFECLVPSCKSESWISLSLSLSLFSSLLISSIILRFFFIELSNYRFDLLNDFEKLELSGWGL